ncbi:hypothetical protein ES705_44823 [subsurface metagenome]
MRKFLVMLMVVAMASFLFVGCIFTVPVAVTGVTLDQATMTLTAGGATGTLVAVVAPADASDTSVTWSSSAPAVATVANGVVKPLTVGETTITVTTVDGSLTDTCVVTVEAAPVLPASATPVITSIDGIDFDSPDPQYMNADEVADGILVMGSAPKYSEINVYVNDEVVGTSTAYEAFEYFIVSVAKADLGDDGEKTIYATATEVASAESANSTEYAFTLDTVVPEIVSFFAEAVDLNENSVATLTVIFSEEIDEGSIDKASGQCLWDVTTPIGETDANPFEPTADPFDLVLSKVLEMKGTITEAGATAAAEAEGPISIRLGYDFTDPWLDGDIDDRDDLTFITDLAGNQLLDFVDFCSLELAN